MMMSVYFSLVLVVLLNIVLVAIVIYIDRGFKRSLKRLDNLGEAMAADAAMFTAHFDGIGAALDSVAIEFGKIEATLGNIEAKLDRHLVERERVPDATKKRTVKRMEGAKMAKGGQNEITLPLPERPPQPRPLKPAKE